MQLRQLKLSFKRTIKWNKYQSKVTIQRQNQYLDYLIDPIFQEVNRLFVLSFEDNAHWISYKQYLVISIWIYDNIRRKIGRGKREDYTTGCLLDYSYFKEYYRMIEIDLRWWSKSNTAN